MKGSELSGFCSPMFTWAAAGMAAKVTNNADFTKVFMGPILIFSFILSHRHGTGLALPRPTLSGGYRGRESPGRA